MLQALSIKGSVLAENKKYPTPEQFFIDFPLYETVEYEDPDLDQGWEVKYYDGTFDSYCPGCNSHSIFRRYWPNGRHISYGNEKWVDAGIFSVQVACTRDASHNLTFIILATGTTLQKIGQTPSVATLNVYDIKKYSKTLSGNYYREFTKAIGLAAHGVGIGSFVYLRRIFESLIEEAHVEAQHLDSWDEAAFQSAKMNEKIKMLEELLPKFLVENRAMYAILSKGIHELGESECLAAFPIVKVGIELVLDEKLEAIRKKQKLEDAKKAISALGSKVGR